MKKPKSSQYNDFWIVLQHRVIANVSISLVWVGAPDGSRAYELIVDGVLETVGTKKECKAVWTKHVRRLNKQKAVPEGGAR